MSRSSSERVSEEDKLREEFIERYAMPMGDIPRIGAEEMANWFISRMKAYAEQKIKQMFEEENNRNEGKIKVRTENGILLLTPEEFEEYKKTLEGALLREVK